MGWSYTPDPPAYMPHRSDDPIKIVEKFQRWLEKQEKKKKERDKDKDKDKKQEPWDQVVQLAVILLISAVITGPVVLVVTRMLAQH